MFRPGGVHWSGVRMIVDRGGRGGTCRSRTDDAWRLGVEGGSPAPNGYFFWKIPRTYHEVSVKTA